MKIIGHRGVRGIAPENSKIAIERALQYRVDEVEIDIRITKDNMPVLCHNRAMRSGDKTNTISDFTYQELKSHHPNLTTLAEALDIVAGKAALYIEVKHGEPVGPVVDTIVEHLHRSRETADMLLGSKSQKTLRELHALLPDIPKIVIEPWSGIRARYRAKQVEAQRISMRSWWLWRGFLQAMQKRGYLVTPYTMNDPTKVAKWQPYIYGVITDRPDRFTSQ